MNELFLAYAPQDKTFIQKLDAALRDQDWDPWVDWEDQPGGDEWWTNVEQGVEAADTFVFIISPDSVASEICNRELEHAKKLNKRIVPVVYRDARGVPDPLPSLNWIFFRETDDFETAFQALTETFQTDLDWVKAHTRLTVRAAVWEDQQRHNSYLLRGDDLKDAEQRLAETDKEPKLTNLQVEYIMASQQHAIRQRRILLGAIAFALITVTLLGCLAAMNVQAQRQAAALKELAQEEANSEATARARAEALQETAEAAAGSAVNRAQAAQTAAAAAGTAEAEASFAQATAVAARDGAERDRQAALVAEQTARAARGIAQTRQAEAEQGRTEALIAQETAQAAEQLARQAQQTAQAAEATAAAQEATAAAGEDAAAALLATAQAQQLAAEAAAEQAIQAQLAAHIAAISAENAKATALAAKAQAEAALAQAQATLAAVQTRQAQADQLLELANTLLQETHIDQVIAIQTEEYMNAQYSVAAAFDGESVWVAHIGPTSPYTITKIRPFNGRERHWTFTELLADIAYGGGAIWVAKSDGVIKLNPSSGNPDTGFSSTFTGALLYANSAIWVASGASIRSFNPANGSPQANYSTGLDGSNNDLAFDGNRFWITDNNQFAVVNATTGARSGPFPLNDPGQIGAFGPEPVSVIFASGYIWMATGDKLLKFQPPNTTPIATFTISGGQLQKLAYDGTNIWASTYSSGDFIRIRPGDGVVLGTISTGDDVNHVVTFDGANLWAFPWFIPFTTKPTLKMPVIFQLIHPIPPPGSESARVVTPPRLLSQGNYIWASSTQNNSLLKINAATGRLANTFDLGAQPLHMDASNAHIWVVVPGDKVLRVDPNTGQIANFTVTGGAKWVAYDPNANQVWVVGDSGITRMEIDGTNRKPFLNGDVIDKAFFGLNRIWVVNTTINKIQGLNANGTPQPPDLTLDPLAGSSSITLVQDLTDDGTDLWLTRGYQLGGWFDLYKIRTDNTTLISFDNALESSTNLKAGPWVGYDNHKQHIWFSLEEIVYRFDKSYPSGQRIFGSPCIFPADITYNAATQSIWLICWSQGVARKLSGHQGLAILSDLETTPLTILGSDTTTTIHLPIIFKHGPAASTLSVEENMPVPNGPPEPPTVTRTPLPTATATPIATPTPTMIPTGLSPPSG